MQHHKIKHLCRCHGLENVANLADRQWSTWKNWKLTRTLPFQHLVYLRSGGDQQQICSSQWWALAHKDLDHHPEIQIGLLCGTYRNIMSAWYEAKWSPAMQYNVPLTKVLSNAKVPFPYNSLKSACNLENTFACPNSLKSFSLHNNTSDMWSVRPYMR